MIRLLRFLWTGSWHEHKWKIINEGRVTMGKYKDGTSIYVGRWYVLQCTECGAIKHKEV